MKNLGYLLITGGFLAGSYFIVQNGETVNLPPYLFALAATAAGIVLARVATRQAATHEGRVSADMDALAASLLRLTEASRSLEAGKDQIDVYDLKNRIDKTFRADLAAFADARESIIVTAGLQAYADVMNPFAAGERYLNRVWSTSTDGYIDEAHTYLTKAREQFEEALAKLEAATSQPR